MAQAQKILALSMTEYSITFLNRKVAAKFISCIHILMNLLSKFLSKYSREYIIVAKILHTLFLTAPESVLLFMLFFFPHQSQSSTLHPLIIWGDIIITNL